MYNLCYNSFTVAQQGKGNPVEGNTKREFHTEKTVTLTQMPKTPFKFPKLVQSLVDKSVSVTCHTG